MSSTTQNPTRTAVRDAVLRHAKYSLGREWTTLSADERFTACGLAVRDLLVERALETEARYERSEAKRLHYLSMEFLMGRALANNLVNLKLIELFDEALGELGESVTALSEHEPDAALGNGGLGRLAACFLDSLATLDLPGYGYGINYEYGLFHQRIDDGAQTERPDHWLADGTPWQIEKTAEAVVVPVYGRIVHDNDRVGQYNPMWMDWHVVVGVPHDMFVAGYGGRTVNALRLYSARASNEFDMRIFNDGDYMRAVEQKIHSETISKVLYPSDSQERGRELRLVQEYFLVACALRDITRRFTAKHDDWRRLPETTAVQMNDTHPALAVAELMRLLVDEQDLPWDVAWEATTNTLAYTNHTLLPEALERWPVPLFERVVPRHLQIVHEINRRFLDEVSTQWPHDYGRQRELSLIEEGDVKQVRMVNLAVVGSHAVNGVAALHTELVKRDLLTGFAELWPEKFNNKTNGVTQRRWMLCANPGLSELITDAIGDAWIRDAGELAGLAPLAENDAFVDEFARVKTENKARLAETISDLCHVAVDPSSLFDVQIKRIHLYKRQLLHLMYVVHQYLELKEEGRSPAVPRTHVFAGKAAPGYWAAKEVIRAVHAVAEVVNGDPDVAGALRVAFLPDYRVSLAEKIFPAADLSEQISTAGMEASGTGNMKFALNGALTMGTLDGANVEIRDAVGDDNIYIFGHRVEEIAEMKASRGLRAAEIYENDHRVRRVVDFLCQERLGSQADAPFSWLFPMLVTEEDPYVHLADMPSYIEAQSRASRDYLDGRAWTRRAILNTAYNGHFSSDRTILEYADEIWNLRSC
jgi:starch phosphorylase